MRSDNNTLMNVKKWLEKTDHTQQWLAKEMDITPSLLSQLFNGERRLQPTHIEKMSNITGISIPNLAASVDNKENELIYSLRGKLSNSEGERGLAQLLLDVEHYVHLSVK